MTKQSDKEAKKARKLAKVWAALLADDELLRQLKQRLAEFDITPAPVVQQPSKRRKGSVKTFSLLDLYEVYWDLNTKPAMALWRNGIELPMALEMSRDQLLAVRNIGSVFADEIIRHRKPVLFRGLHVPLPMDFEYAKELLEKAHDVDATGTLEYALEDGQIITAPYDIFPMIVQIMNENDVGCSEAPIGV